MRKAKLFLAAAIIAGSSMASMAPVAATECNPKGCSGGCHLNDPRDANIDVRTLTIEMRSPIECYA